ncbi:hypothetical protein BAUCODRAFT_243051 [Baudoinia panamericana UAMH 10762]|uniref:Uncharacterized protein n=1 Tax=Baudoinia panamericana (strain UAMH 10762) TaxID=717646 RepID=M2LH87_BAUPA|nr:uncharacterized protein BAUCODRAFT_243051 [Baudoinia panamericana UAMH 10762]EMC93487.1 hypothetical protein BAUCODRAFT_243051 [Baudoinia panamericana UAMH 10762]
MSSTTTSTDGTSATSVGDPPPYYKHLATIKDGITRNPGIRPARDLAVLYEYNDGRNDNALIRNLAGKVQPAVPCSLLLEDGRRFPLTIGSRDSFYELRLTHNTLLLAPTVRLECTFQSRDPPHASYLTLALEWHWHDYNGQSCSIKNYGQHAEDESVVEFYAGPPTPSEGFGWVGHTMPRLSPAEADLVETLRTICTTDVRRLYGFELRLKRMSITDITKLRKVWSLLPGGSGPPLPSFGAKLAFAPFLPRGLVYASTKEDMQKPYALTTGSVKHPWVTLECADSFRTISEAVLQLSYSVHIAEAEAKVALQLWAKPVQPHRYRLFAKGDFQVLGVKFSRFRRLGSDQDARYRLPNQLHSKMTLIVRGARELEVSGFLTENTTGILAHDAYFIITSESLVWLALDAKAAELTFSEAYYNVTFEPHYNSFTHTSQLATGYQLSRSKNKRWHPVLLNQGHDLIDCINLVDMPWVRPNVKATAERRLKLRVECNAEQLRVINGLERARGDLVLITGPAGTGKTLLHEALADYPTKTAFTSLY